MSRSFRPGEVLPGEGEIIANAGRKTVRLVVRNLGDRPVQVGSHYHFFEVNKCMDFPRKETLGMRLNIPAGTSTRFEPGTEKEVELVEICGRRTYRGHNDLAGGRTAGDALTAAKKKGFRGA
jgi:urease, beta subunit